MKATAGTEAAAQVPQHGEQPGGADRERGDQRRADVGQAEPDRRRVSGRGPEPQPATERVHRGNRQVERQPQQHRPDRHDVVRARRLAEVRELGGHVQIAIEDDAAQLREVGHAIGADAVRVGHQHAERVQQARDRAHAVRRGPQMSRPRPALAAGLPRRDQREDREPGQQDEPARRAGRRGEQASDPDHDECGEHRPDDTLPLRRDRSQCAGGQPRTRNRWSLVAADTLARRLPGRGQRVLLPGRGSLLLVPAPQRLHPGGDVPPPAGRRPVRHRWRQRLRRAGPGGRRPAGRGRRAGPGRRPQCPIARPRSRHLFDARRCGICRRGVAGGRPLRRAGTHR